MKNKEKPKSLKLIDNAMIDKAIESAVKKQEAELAMGGRTCLDELSIRLQEKLQREDILVNDVGLFCKIFIM